MNNVKYDREMERIIAGLKKAGEKPALLLHACCAPCSSACIERVKGGFDVTVYYYNPNIDTETEYFKRRMEQERLCAAFGVNFLSEKYSPQEFYAAAKGLEDAPEGGARCEKCFYLRLKRTAEKAKEQGFGYFATTLTLSPLKNAALLNQTGERVAAETGVKYLPSDFKKKGGYLLSVELSEKYSLYRQNYCGCAFSKNKNPADF